MTIICVKDGIVAADTAIWIGEVMRGEGMKIWRVKGHIFGAAGDSAACERFERWSQKSKAPWTGFLPKAEADDETPEFEALIVAPSGKVTLIDNAGNVMDGIEADFHAIGVAAELAIGAMMAGASSAEAAAHCIERHAFCGGKVTYLAVGETKASASLADWLTNAATASNPIVHYMEGKYLQ